MAFEMLETKIQFNGLTFDLNSDRTSPIAVSGSQRDTVLEENAILLDFLQTLNQEGLLGNEANSGLVVYADDQYVNQQAMQINFQDIGAADKLVLFSNGKETLFYF